MNVSPKQLVGLGTLVLDVFFIQPAKADSFLANSPMTTARAQHTTTLLRTGELLVVGGNNTGGDLSGAELYNPQDAKWAATGMLPSARNSHTATLLTNGVPEAGSQTSALLAMTPPLLAPPVPSVPPATNTLPSASNTIVQPPTSPWLDRTGPHYCKYRLLRHQAKAKTILHHFPDDGILFAVGLQTLDAESFPPKEQPV